MLLQIKMSGYSVARCSAPYIGNNYWECRKAKDSDALNWVHIGCDASIHGVQNCDTTMPDQKDQCPGVIAHKKCDLTHTKVCNSEKTLKEKCTDLMTPEIDYTD